nr:MAG TPA: hypothetical protein [Caudoviricetes sp.]
MVVSEAAGQRCPAAFDFGVCRHNPPRGTGAALRDAASPR